MRTNAIFYLTLALCAGVVSACVDENINSDKDVNGKAIKFGLSSQRTKTVYDDTDPYQINWVKGDQIKIFCAEAESAKSALYNVTPVDKNVTPADTAKNGTIANAGSDVLQWGGDGLTHNFYAIYPGAADGVTVSEDGIATFTINHNQKCTVTTTNGYDANVVAKPDMKNALMVAHTATEPTDNTVSLAFKPIMTTLEIVVTGPTSNINSSNARVTGISLAATMTTNSGSEAASFQYDIKNGAIVGNAGSGEVTTKTETTFISLVDANGNATYVDLANGHTLTFTVFMPPMSKEQAALLKRQLKVRVHITGNAELTASVKTNTDTDPWTTQIAPSTKKKIILPAIPSTSQVGNNWITPLDDNIYVSQLSIPGTHDAATGDGTDYSLGKTQELTLDQQFEIGIRAFDLRPAVSGSDLILCHGVVATTFNWDQVMGRFKYYLSEHPGEFIIALIRHEDEYDNNNSSWGSIMQSKLESLKAEINPKTKESYTADFKPDLTVGELRGKILFLCRDWTKYNDAGPVVGGYTGWSHNKDGAEVSIYSRSNSGILNIQDCYAPSESGAWGGLITGSAINNNNNKNLVVNFPTVKWNAIQTLLNKSMKFHTDLALINRWSVNHTSGYVGGKVLGLYNSVSTTDGYRENAANNNIKLYNYINSTTWCGSTGIVLMDFVGAHTSGSYTVYGDLCPQAIIDNNYKYRMRRKGE